MNRIDNETFYAELAREISIAPFARIGSLDEIPVSSNSRLSVGMECLDRDLWDYRPAMADLRKLGVVHVRLQSGWEKTEKIKGVYDFQWLDEVVDTLVELNITPWLCLCYGNKLYAAPRAELRIGGIGHVPIDSVEAENAWLKYVEKVVERYIDRISVYEVWNEPDCKVFFPGEGWAEKYVGMVAKTSQVIRQTASGRAVKVCGCVAGNIGVSSYHAENLLKLGIGSYIDIFCYHGYRILPEQLNDQLRRSYRLMFDRYAPHVKIWQGESGIPSYNAPTSYGALSNMEVSEKIQVRHVARRIVLELADPSLELVSYFHLYDFTHFSRRHNYYYGLLRQEDYSRKPAYEALQFLSVFCDRNTVPDPASTLEIWPQVPENLSKTDILSCQTKAFKQSGDTIFAYWYPAELNTVFSPQTVNLDYRTADGSFFAEAVIIDPLTRLVYHAPVKGKPWQITGVPICSYPLLLVDWKQFSSKLTTVWEDLRLSIRQIIVK